MSRTPDLPPIIATYMHTLEVREATVHEGFGFPGGPDAQVLGRLNERIEGAEGSPEFSRGILVAGAAAARILESSVLGSVSGTLSQGDETEPDAINLLEVAASYLHDHAQPVDPRRARILRTARGAGIVLVDPVVSITQHTDDFEGLFARWKLVLAPSAPTSEKKQKQEHDAALDTPFSFTDAAVLTLFLQEFGSALARESIQVTPETAARVLGAMEDSHKVTQDVHAARRDALARLGVLLQSPDQYEEATLGFDDRNDDVARAFLEEMKATVDPQRYAIVRSLVEADRVWNITMRPAGERQALEIHKVTSDIRYHDGIPMFTQADLVDHNVAAVLRSLDGEDLQAGHTCAALLQDVRARATGAGLRNGTEAYRVGALDRVFLGMGLPAAIRTAREASVVPRRLSNPQLVTLEEVATALLYGQAPVRDFVEREAHTAVRVLVAEALATHTGKNIL